MISSYETPGSSPVPRWIARLMLSAGMLTDLASATMVRSRGFASMSPPPARAATVSSLMMRVKILPRLASAAPFLCLIVCHLEWPDMAKPPRKSAEKTVDPTIDVRLAATRGPCLGYRLRASGFRYVLSRHPDMLLRFLLIRTCSKRPDSSRLTLEMSHQPAQISIREYVRSPTP